VCAGGAGGPTHTYTHTAPGRLRHAFLLDPRPVVIIIVKCLFEWGERCRSNPPRSAVVVDEERKPTTASVGKFEARQAKRSSQSGSASLSLTLPLSLPLSRPRSLALPLYPFIPSGMKGCGGVGGPLGQGIYNPFLHQIEPLSRQAISYRPFHICILFGEYTLSHKHTYV
jgi:hypothetical protein